MGPLKTRCLLTAFVSVGCREPELVFPKLEISAEHQEMLMATLRRKLTANPFKIRVDI